MGESQQWILSRMGEPTKLSIFLHETARMMLESPSSHYFTAWFHSVLAAVGVPKPYPTADQIALCTLAAMTGLVLYFLAFGWRHRNQRSSMKGRIERLRNELAQAEGKLKDMDSGTVKRKADGKPIRIWMDGAFDMMHYGHMNAFRQGRALGTQLVVGINSDESITACKGPPVMDDDERIMSVASCKFVDEVVPRAPYIMSDQYIQETVFGQYKCDYVVHGDDPCIVDGKDVFASAKAAGKYLEIPRTEGVSTTDIVGRMLLVTKSHHRHRSMSDEGQGAAYGSPRGSPRTVTAEASRSASGVTEAQIDAALQQANRSSFLATNLLLQLFGAGTKPPAAGARIVYMDGAWDMFHSGHAMTLKKARELGDYLIVGVHSDKLVNDQRGANYPILNMHERVLSVLGCKFVDDVLLDAPWALTSDMIKSLKISVVAHGTTVQPEGEEHHSPSGRNSVPIELGIFTSIESSNDLTVGGIVERIKNQEQRFKAKFAKKIKAENEYYAQRYDADVTDQERGTGPPESKKGK